MPIAIKIANFHDAELIVAHVIPDLAITEIGPPDTETLELRRQFSDRNQRTANDYLNGIKSRFAYDVPSLSTRLVVKGDVRHELVNTSIQEKADLLLIASHGSTGYTDVSTGSVARFVLEHGTVPILMIGCEREVNNQFETSNTHSHTGRRPCALI